MTTFREAMRDMTGPTVAADVPTGAPLITGADVPLDTLDDGLYLAADGTVVLRQGDTDTTVGAAPAVASRPASLGIVSESAPIWTFPTEVGPASGELRAVGLPLPPGATVTGAVLFLATGGSGLTSGRVALYNSALALVASSGDIKASVTGSAAWTAVLPFTTPYVAGDDPEWVYFASLYLGTTPPTTLGEQASGSDKAMPPNGFLNNFRQTGLAALPDPVVPASGNIGTYVALV